jgi:hypothetical protein
MIVGAVLVKVHVVDAHNFSTVDVNDLLIEQITAEQ